MAPVDLVSGETTRIGDVSAEKCAFDLEFTPDGTRLFGTRIDDDVAHLVEFDLTTGAVTVLGVLGDFTLGGPRVLPLPRERRRHHRPHLRELGAQTFTVYHGLATSCAGSTSSVRDPQRNEDGRAADRGGHAALHRLTVRVGT